MDKTKAVARQPLSRAPIRFTLGYFDDNLSEHNYRVLSSLHYGPKFFGVGTQNDRLLFICRDDPVVIGLKRMEDRWAFRKVVKFNAAECDKMKCY